MFKWWRDKIGWHHRKNLCLWGWQAGLSSWPDHWGMWNLGHSFQVLVSSRHRSGNTSSSGSFLTRPQWPVRCEHPWLYSHWPSIQCGPLRKVFDYQWASAMNEKSNMRVQRTLWSYIRPERYSFSHSHHQANTRQAVHEDSLQWDKWACFSQLPASFTKNPQNSLLPKVQLLLYLRREFL